MSTPRARETAPPPIPRPSMFLYDPGDDEQTRETLIADRAGQAAVHELTTERAGQAVPVQFVKLPSEEWIVLEVHGQRSATAHGWQGLRPNRLAFLRRLLGDGYPVLLIFVEGYESYWQAWLHDLGAAGAISKGDGADRDSMRYGWRCAELERRHGALDIPDSVPAPKPKGQEALA